MKLFKSYKFYLVISLIYAICMFFYFRGEWKAHQIKLAELALQAKIEAMDIEIVSIEPLQDEFVMVGFVSKGKTDVPSETKTAELTVKIRSVSELSIGATGKLIHLELKKDHEYKFIPKDE